MQLHCHTFLFFLRKITIFSYPTAPLFLPLISTVASITDGAGISISTVNEGSGPGAEVSTTIQISIREGGEKEEKKGKKKNCIVMGWCREWEEDVVDSPHHGRIFFLPCLLNIGLWHMWVLHPLPIRLGNKD